MQGGYVAHLAMISLRNIAIVAHVDHGKTTLVDAMLKETGAVRQGSQVQDRVMDSNDLERERGITILAKQCSVVYKDTRVNIIDTPGHADFGGEVERTVRMADGILLLVDAAEGPLPQTRFVLGKAIELGLSILVVINKVDRSDARPDEVLNEVFDLFCDLGASEAQLDFKTIYAIGKEGKAGLSVDKLEPSLTCLFEMIMKEVPAPKNDPEGAFQFLVHEIQHDDYVGRLAIGRIARGRVKDGQPIMWINEKGEKKTNITTVYGFQSMNRVAIKESFAGDIVALAGVDEVKIGDSFTDLEVREALPRINVEEPTLKVSIMVNTSPFAGKSGKWVTSRHIRERLEKEAQKNLAMRFEPTDMPEVFTVYVRGELMLSILLETIRREGYEVAVGMPEVITKTLEDGRIQEPAELVVIDVPDNHVGSVTTALGSRKGQMTKMSNLGFGRTRIEYRIPSRGLIGFRSQFLTLTRGTGLLNTILDGWDDWQGPMMRRMNGALVSDRMGETTEYALDHLQPRGILFLGPGEKVYEGMIVGEHNRDNDLDVNIVREKKLTNVRSKNKDENVMLSPPQLVTLETGLEFIDRDELLEVTPDALRLRKKVLPAATRPRRTDA